MEKLLYCYENRSAAQELGRAGRRHIETFTWDAYERKLVEVYQKLLEGRVTQS
jgi:glycosyltransferase involved in cell wall biosynthesis